MIQVYSDSISVKKALQIYADGRPSRLVDCVLVDGAPDPAQTHASIVKRYAAGEPINVNPYPNEVFPAPEVIRPKKWCKAQILTLESCPPYYIGRGVEEAIVIQPQAAQDALYVRVKKIIALKTDLRAIVSSDPDAWQTGQQEALQVRIDEVIGWSA